MKNAMSLLRLSLTVRIGLGFLLALILLVSPRTSPAQQSSGLTGVVIDSTGAVVTGVEVKLFNTLTGATYTTKTDEQGVYSFPRVPPSPGYSLTFTKESFRTLTISGISVGVGVTETHNAQLEVGSVAQTVEVTATGEATLNTTDATIGNVIDARRIKDLPIQIRSTPAALIGLQPGVVANSGGGGNRVGSVTGARTDQGNITIDGIDANDVTTGQAFATVGNLPIDALQEFRAITTNPEADDGRSSGGQIKLVTKGGTNDWHGSARYFLRHDKFAANSFFNNKNRIARPKLRRHQFGSSFGGAAIKDKLFFFFDYEGRRDASGVSNTRTVPLDHVRQGQIGYIRTGVDNGGANCNFQARLTTKPECIVFQTTAQSAGLDPRGTGIDAALLTFVTGRYPQANDLSLGDGVNTGGFRFNSPVKRADNTYTTRIDWQPSTSHQLFSRFNFARRRQTDTINSVAAQFPGDPETAQIIVQDYAWVVGHTWTINRNSQNQITVGITRSGLQFPTLFQPAFPNSFTFANNGAGTAILSAPFAGISSQDRFVPVPTIRDDYTYTHGRHTWQFGGSVKPIQQKSGLVNDFNFVTMGLGGLTNGLNSSLRPGNILNSATARRQYDSMYTFLLGRFGQIATNFNYSPTGTPFVPGTGKKRNFHYNEYEFYGQDSWRLRSDLTVTLGLRWGYYGVPFEADGFQATNDIDFRNLFAVRVANGAAGIGGDSAEPFLRYDLGGKANNARGYSDPDLNNFAPRVSIAWNPSFRDNFLGKIFGDRKTSIRAGGSVVYDRVGGAVTFIQDQVSYLFDNSATINFGNVNANTALLNDPRFTSIGSLPSIPTAPTITRPFTPFVSGGVPFGNAEGDANYAVSQDFRTPYAYTFSFGIQRELPRNFFFEVNYVGRLGHKLWAQADAAQIVDFKDLTSGQFLQAAFNAMQAQIIAGSPITPQPWFENQCFAGCTALVASALGGLVEIGDLSDTIQALNGSGLIANNVGLSGQFSTNAYITNLSSSNYHGLLVSARKRFSDKIQFDFNYTLSHSIDNQSSITNTVFGGLVCDIRNLRVCRGNSNFDVRHNISMNGIYELPVGRGQRFAGGAPRWLDAIIGGWEASGIWTWRTGFAFTTTTDAFPVGFVFNSPAVLTGSPSAIRGGLGTDSSGNITYFGDTTAALAALRNPHGGEIGNRNNLRGPGFSNVDLGILKSFKMPYKESHKLQFRVEMFNAFNNVSFNFPNANINSGSFGRITSEVTAPREMQFALRYDF